jgi:hypothetical protein
MLTWTATCRSWRASFYDPDRRLNASKASPRIASTYPDGMSRFAKESPRQMGFTNVSRLQRHRSYRNVTHAPGPLVSFRLNRKRDSLVVGANLQRLLPCRALPSPHPLGFNGRESLSFRSSLQRTNTPSERPLAIQLLEQPRKV